MQLANRISKLRNVWNLSRMDLVGPYREYFRITIADTDALRKEVFRLRYEVYCRELGWEDPRDSPDQLEQDPYDAQSQHCLLTHLRSGARAGTIRMVIPGKPSLEPPIPLVKHCGTHLYDGSLRPDRLPIGSFGEISRLALHNEFRRRPKEDRDAAGNGEKLFEWAQDERRRFPHISLGLYLGASAIALADGATGVYAIMEPRLARHLRIAGIRFEQVGGPIEFHGSRAPYYISRKTLFRHLSRPLKKLLSAIAEDMRLNI